MTRAIIKQLNSIFPQLKSSGFKGANGRIGVIGGSYEFTGAPFYSAISALRAGGDMAHIFCSKASSVSIKSYSPQIIVHPVFQSEEEIIYSKSQLHQVHNKWISKIQSWQKAIHSWVIGPGLGRDRYMQQFFPILVRNIGHGKVVIFDADGIFYLSQNPHLFEHLKNFKTILTPNHRELSFLQPYLKLKSTKDIKFANIEQEIQQLADKYTKLHDFSLIIKGENDIILGPKSYAVRTQTSYKRCGGIGDILAGVTSVCAFWDFDKGPALASRIVKKAARKAYQKQGRSLTAPYIVQQLSETIKEMELQNQL